MHHSIEICQQIAEKMKSPDQVVELIKDNIVRRDFPEPEWPLGSFIEGLPGIACFYASMDQYFPNEGWIKIANDYLTLAVRDFEKNGYSNCSLFAGLTGLCFAVNMCSNQGRYYQKLQTKLEALLCEEVEKSFLREAKKHIEGNLDTPPNLYNLASGISGALAYLLLRLDQPRLYKLSIDCLTQLIELLNHSCSIDGREFPGWYVSTENQMAEEEKEKYPEGSFILGTPYGITGCLSALSLSAISRLKVPGLIETIGQVADWLKNCAGRDAYGINWQHTIPAKNENRNESSIEGLDRDTWWYGIPAVTRSLYLASKAMKDRELSGFAEKTFLSMFSKSFKDWNLMGPSFVHGRAGLLATTYRMAQDIQSPLLWKKVDELENDLKGFYRPDALFGFQMVHVDSSDNYRWIDHPGLFRGASGVALSLLLVQRREELIWDRAFLIN